MVAQMASDPANISLIEFIAAEWHGEGNLLGRGAYSELIWAALVTPATGLDIMISPASGFNAHAFGLVLECYPALLVSGLLLFAGIMDIAGLALFFFRGRCVASRTCRLVGTTAALAIWSVLFITAMVAFHGEFAPLVMYFGVCCSIARPCSLSWRVRF